MSRMQLGAVVVATLATTTACGASNVESQPTPQGEPLNVSLARSYANLDEVVDGSDAVVHVRAGEATTEEVGEIMFTFTTAEILDTVTGSVEGPDLRIVQTGEQGAWYIPELPPFLRVDFRSSGCGYAA